MAIVSATSTEFDRLYREHYRPLVRLASILVDDVSVCEEIVQDAFVAVVRRGGGWADAERAPAYLRSAVLNGARSHLRKQQVRRRWLRMARPPDDGPSADRPALLAAEHRTMLDALRALPERQREVLALRYYVELSEAEIADTLGISRGSVKTHAHRGLATLATRFEEDER
ncbi:MAG: SigE family RNA polymerase sigma factor [Acidimicrobiales bacterium]